MCFGICKNVCSSDLFAVTNKILSLPVQGAFVQEEWPVIISVYIINALCGLLFSFKIYALNMRIN